MYPSRIVAKSLKSMLLTAAVATVLTAPAVAQPSIKIQVKKSGADCTAKNACQIYAQQRAVGVCRTEKNDTVNPGVGTYCHEGFEWELKGQGKLTDDHLVVITWSPQSSPGSEDCLEKATYFLSLASPKVAPVLKSGSSSCTGKAVWLYDVVLLYKGAEIDRDDPGVLIED